MISRLMLNLRDPMLLKPGAGARKPGTVTWTTTTGRSINALHPSHTYPPGAGPISTLAVTTEDVGFEDTYVYTDEQETMALARSNLRTYEPNSGTGRVHSNDISRRMFSMNFNLELMG
jgi:hypothetical protein